MLASVFAVLLVTQEAPLPAVEALKDDLWRMFYKWSQVGNLLEGDTRYIEGDTLKHYTFTEKATRFNLDSKGNVRDTETNVYHVIQGTEPWQYYRKLISKNGVPLGAAELEKQDRDQRKREQKLRNEMERAAKEAEKKKAELKPQQASSGNAVEDLFQMLSRVYDIQVVRRELLGDYRTVLISLTPKPGIKPKDEDAKWMQHIAIRAWTTEQDHQPVKVEVEFLDQMSFGFGILGNIQPGTGGKLERRKINDEVWAPIRAEATINGRMLVKGMNQRQIAEYSDFRKYTVETLLNVVPVDPEVK